MLLTKKIMPAGRFRVASPKGRISKEFNQSYLSSIADISNQMLKAGLNIPAPFDHHKDAIPEIKINKAQSAFENAGYWTNFWVAPDDEGKPSLYGQLDAAGDPKDPTSPAFKALNTNKEVSISINDNFEDGLGRTWTDGLMHVALVHHAVVPGQEPFKEGVTVVNMSMLEPGSDEESLVEELKAVLPGINVVLPASTNSKTFLRDLLVAISNCSKQSGGSELEPVPIYMSVGDESMAFSKEQAESLVATKAINPSTKKAWTMEDLGFKPAASETKDVAVLQASIAEKDAKLNSALNLLNALKQKLVDDTKATIETRLNALVSSGVVPKEYVDSQLRPQLEFQMSVTTDGKIASHPLECVLSALEAQPKKQAAPGSVPAGAVFEVNDAYAAQEATPEEMEASFKLLEAEGLL